MTMGERIAAKRRQKGFTQEYLAAKLGISRQSVSKWEKDITRPDTANLMRLSDLLDTDAGYLLIGQGEKIAAQKPSAGRKALPALIFAAVILFYTRAAAVIHFLPVSRDAAGCRDGYASFIFSEYSDRLVEKYVAGHRDKENIISADAVPGSRQTHWSGRRIYLTFDVDTHYTYGNERCKVTFYGDRQWTDSYTWGGAVIVG